VTIAPDPPLWLQNGEYAARLDRQLIAAVLPEGIVRGLAVSPNTPAPNYNVSVAEGMACVHGDDEDEQGAYLALLPDPVSVTVAAPGGMNRIDLVVLRVNDSQAGGAAGDNTTVEIVQGTGTTGTPAAPTLPPTAIPLMRVTLAPSTSAITAAELSGLERPFARGVGILEEFAGPVAPTWGLLCDGRTVSRADYADLFSVIGTTWGAGNGSTTFNVPNFKGRSAVCIDTADTLFSTVGRLGGSKNAIVVAHVHPITHDHPPINTSFAGSHDHAYNRMVESATKGAGSQNAGTSLETVRTGDAGNHQHTANVAPFTGNSGAAAGGVSGTNANMPPFAVVNYVIRF
jgi:microcystin-dependent protein